MGQAVRGRQALIEGGSGGRHGPRTGCVFHCCACGGHFSSLAAFDSHRVGPQGARVCDTDREKDGRALLVPKTENGTCSLSSPPRVGGCVVWASAGWWKAAQDFERAA
jgi:hypothetical protein